MICLTNILLDLVAQQLAVRYAVICLNVLAWNNFARSSISKVAQVQPRILQTIHIRQLRGFELAVTGNPKGVKDSRIYRLNQDQYYYGYAKVSNKLNWIQSGS